MVDRNYRPPTTRGEIDLIGWDAGTLVFVEVKTRRSVEVRAPELDVDRNKELLIKAAAREYRQQRRCSASPFRFDVISVEISGKDFRIQHFQDAFR